MTEVLLFHGNSYTGTLEEFFEKGIKAYDKPEFNKVNGFLKVPKGKTYENLTPKQALEKIKELYEKGELSNKNY